jgi:hypothetical protein
MSKFDKRDIGKSVPKPETPIMRANQCIICFLNENHISVVFKYISFNKETVVIQKFIGGVLRSLKFWLLRRGLTSTMFRI